jgi:hypothetical protein
MFRILRAFAWMRWRVFINALERTGARDTLERFSLAVDKIGPIVAALLLVPSMIGMAAFSVVAGYTAASRPEIPPILFDVVLRALTLAFSAVAIVGPIAFPVMERANPVRLLLLPIPRTTLYIAQASGSLGDPWTLVAIPLALFLPLGLALGGSLASAAVSIVGGLLFLLVLVGLSTLTACVVQLVARDRRRGELAALAFILLIPLFGMLMNLADEGVSRRNRHRPSPAPIEQSAERTLANRLARGAFRMTPSEQFLGAARTAVAGSLAASATALLVLAATAAIVHGSALLVFERLLAFPGAVSRRRTGPRRTRQVTRIPGLSPGANAVALAQIRLTLRTPRGRSTLLSPLLVFAVFAVLSMRNGDVPRSLVAYNGVGLALFGECFSLLTIVVFAMNQFALDGAGLTLELLSPLPDKDLLDGKAVATGLTAGAPALLCLLVAFLLFPGGSTALWVSVPLAGAAVYLLLSPVAAAVSTLFPRVVDLNSVGRGSNPHGLAGLIGVATVVLSGLPPAALALFAIGWLQRPELTPVFLLLWCVLTFAVNRVLFRPLRSLFAKRRENLAMVVG